MLKFYYIDTGSFIVSLESVRCLIEDLKDFTEDFDFSDFDPSRELCSEDNEKIVGKMKLETAPNLNFYEPVFF